MITYSFYIDGVRCEIADTEAFAITYQLQDFRDLNLLRRRTFSKTFSVYGNNEINQVFANVWDIKFTATTQIAVSFDQKKRKECTIYENEAPFIDGAVILESVTIENSVYKYNFKFVSSSLAVFNKLNEFTLNQLEAFSKYNHVLNATNVLDTWDSYNYINGQRVIRPLGEGYIYPLGFYGSLTQTGVNQYEVKPTNKFNTHKLIPAFAVYELFMECFKHIGVEALLPSTFNNFWISGDFEQLKRQIGGVSLIKTAKTEMLYSQINIGTPPNDWIVERGAGGLGFNYYNSAANFSRVEVLDEDDCYTYPRYVSKRKGKLTIRLDYKEKFINQYNVSYRTVALQVYVNNLHRTTFAIVPFALNTPAGEHATEVIREVSIDVNIGDVVSLAYSQSFIQQDAQPYPICEIYRFNLDYIIEYTSYGVNDVVKMTDWLPKIKAIDFVTAIIKMFNLYISEVNQNKITFQTENQFYDGWQTAINIDQHIDRNNPIEVKSMILEQNIRSVTYRYKQPNDFCNKFLKDTYNVDYGTKKIEINTDVCTEDKVLEIPFSLIMPNQIEGTPLFYHMCYDFKNNKYEPVQFAPFLFSERGKITGNIQLIDVEGNTFTVHNSTMFLACNAAVSIPFGSAGRYSLYFEPPEYLLYIPPSEFETTQTIFNEFISPSIEAAIRDDAKLIKLSVATEVFTKHRPEKLLRKLINIDGALYKINKIIDYNVNKASVEVELIKVVYIERDIVYPEPEPIKQPIE